MGRGEGGGSSETRKSLIGKRRSGGSIQTRIETYERGGSRIWKRISACFLAKVKRLERTINEQEARITAIVRTHAEESANHQSWKRQYQTALTERTESLQRYAVCLFGSLERRH